MTARNRVFPLFIPHRGCPHDCVFCDQRRVSGQRKPVTPADVAASLSALAAPVDELAFYGGSFTALPLAEQAALLDAAQPYLERGVIRRLRVSTRPDAIGAEVLDLLQSRHVETVELGAQSMDDGVLLACGRGHTAADTARAAQMVRERGFRLILQMMTGLPGSSDELDLLTGERLAALRPDGVRVYPTVILRGTPLYALWKSGAYRERSVEDAIRVCARLLPIFERAGIPVIRLGLNPTGDLSAGDAAGGAYHPALGELVQSRIFLEKARTLLHGSRPGGDVALGVCKSDISKMTGRHRRNIEALKVEFRLRSVRVTEADVPQGGIVIVKEPSTCI